MGLRSPLVLSPPRRAAAGQHRQQRLSSRL